MEQIDSVKLYHEYFKKAFHTKGFFYFCILVFVSVGLYFKSLMMIDQLPARSRDLVPPPKGLEHFSFGMKEQIADSIWVRAIQDFDYCEKKIDLTNCQNKGWLWRMLEAITNLSPQFRSAYSSGAIALSVIVSDVEGASSLFDKAVKEFPSDWVILYRAAYHALYEEKNNKKAAQLMERVSKNGGPPWTASLAGKLYIDAGEIEFSERLIEELKSQNASEIIIKRIQNRIDQVRKKRP